jgi:hypothetical protein
LAPPNVEIPIHRHREHIELEEDQHPDDFCGRVDGSVFYYGDNVPSQEYKAEKHDAYVKDEKADEVSGHNVRVRVWAKAESPGNNCASDHADDKVAQGQQGESK